MRRKQKNVELEKWKQKQIGNSSRVIETEELESKREGDRNNLEATERETEGGRQKQIVSY